MPAIFDASGHPDDSPVLFVSGYVSTEKKWLRFERKWTELLSSYEISGQFHMTDFASGVGQYGSWKNDQAKRKQFLAEAIKIVKTNTNKSFSSGVVIKDLKRAQAEYELGNSYAPYTWNALKTCIQVAEWMKRKLKNDEPVKFIFELGDRDQSEFARAARKLFGFSPLFVDKRDCVPFQAADLIAWEHRRLAQHFTAGDFQSGKARPRGSVKAIALTIPHDQSWTFWNWTFLEKNLNAQGFKKRTNNAD